MPHDAAAVAAAPAAHAHWHGQLSLHYTRDGERTIAHDRHEGPLRVLQRLYPEGPGICHHVLVHPPGGIVGGDELEIDERLDAGTHALITTPGATRFYRSSGAAAAQRAVLRVAGGARLEWLPLETIAYSGCLAENRVQLDLANGAEAIGWDLLALGLPAAGEPFEAGHFTQHLEIPGRWLERGRVAASDTRLLESPLGLAGRRVMATAWFASGSRMCRHFAIGRALRRDRPACGRDRLARARRKGRARDGAVATGARRMAKPGLAPARQHAAGLADLRAALVSCAAPVRPYRRDSARCCATEARS